MPTDPPPERRIRRVLWASVAFLMGFSALIVLIAHYYLLPAIDAARDADPAGRRQLSAFSTLLLAVVLFTLLVSLLVTFRVRKFFMPRSSPQRTRTEHIDAWTESARRMATPPPEDSDDE